jgi:hypothetical protein
MQRIGDDAERVVQHVLERVTAEGPLMSKDFEHAESNGPWWGWKPQKAALEYLWRIGRLVVSRRVNFHKVYDLPERAMPELIAQPEPDERAHRDWACRGALERLGVATSGEIAAFFDAVGPDDAKAWCAEAARRGEIVAVSVASADGAAPRRAFTLHDWNKRAAAARQALAKSADGMIRPLSPFDPVVRDRRRAKRYFDFDYAFEGFTPAAKRKYGYYVLPLLEGDRFVGRLDPKLHRDRGVLEIKGLWWEPDVKVTPPRRRALEAGLAAFARFAGADRIVRSRTARNVLSA